MPYSPPESKARRRPAVGTPSVTNRRATTPHPGPLPEVEGGQLVLNARNRLAGEGTRRFLTEHRHVGGTTGGFFIRVFWLLERGLHEACHLRPPLRCTLKQHFQLVSARSRSPFSRSMAHQVKSPPSFADAWTSRRH